MDGSDKVAQSVSDRRTPLPILVSTADVSTERHVTFTSYQLATFYLQTNSSVVDSDTN